MKIPLKLYKTGPYDVINLNSIKNININSAKKLNASYHIYDDDMCRQFIKNNFNTFIINAYDNLIPTAYKADLWRYCILYKNGGIYTDLSYNLIKNIDVNKDGADMILTKDIPENCLQIGFIASIPKNNFLKYVINKVCLNIFNNNKGKSTLHVTGPCIFGELFFAFFKKSFKKNDIIKPGLNKYNGIDGKTYLIDIKFKKSNKSYITDFNNNKYINTYVGNHYKILYKNIFNHYDYLWLFNNIYKNQNCNINKYIICIIILIIIITTLVFKIYSRKCI